MGTAYEYVLSMEIDSLSLYMAEHDGICQYIMMDQHVLVHTGTYWYVLVCPEYRHHASGCSAGFAPAILGCRAPGNLKHWIGCLCRSGQIHKCMHKLIYSYCLQLGDNHELLLQLLPLAMKPLAADNRCRLLRC